MNISTLDELKIGQKAKIIALKEGEHSCQRIAEMGLTPGEEVEVIRYAPLGDPMEISIRGYSLSLRKAEAMTVEVEVLNPGIESENS